jgi:hypothetical protein
VHHPQIWPNKKKVDIFILVEWGKPRGVALLDFGEDHREKPSEKKKSFAETASNSLASDLKIDRLESKSTYDAERI